MRISKWGKSLAISLRAAVVAVLNLKEGGPIEVRVEGERQFDADRDRRRAEALETLRRLQRPLPPGFKFDREQAHERYRE